MKTMSLTQRGITTTRLDWDVWSLEEVGTKIHLQQKICKKTEAAVEAAHSIGIMMFDLLQTRQDHWAIEI